jgi:L-iditol 2-dehydrogenase
MKAAVLKTPGILELDNIPDSICPTGGALIEVKVCSVCGTDVKMFMKGHKDLVYPRILGHEIVGKVLEIDKKNSIKEGDLVQVWPGVACGKCKPCQKGLDNQCENMLILGFNQDGGFSEMLALPKESVSNGMNLISSKCNIDSISLAEPLACCLNGQELTRVSKCDVVLIIGGGPIGCLHAILANLQGTEKIIIAEKLENRIEIIKKHTSCDILDTSHSLEEAIAEQTNHQGVDVILMATPDFKIDNSLLKMLAPGGRLCVFSGPNPGNHEEMINIRSVHYRELTIVGAYGCTSIQNKKAVELLTSGKVKADWVITKRTSLENIQDAIDHSIERSGLKSLIYTN